MAKHALNKASLHKSIIKQPVPYHNEHAN